MARVKRGVAAKRRHKKVLEQAKGYYGNKSRSFRAANEQVMRSGQYAFRDRRARKGEFRRLWIQRINAATRQHDMSLQPVHRRAERRRHRGRPQDPRRSRRHRRRPRSARSSRRPRRRSDRQRSAPLGVHQPADPTTAAPPRAPQFAFRGGRVRRRGRRARRARRSPPAGSSRPSSSPPASTPVDGAGAGPRRWPPASPSGSPPPRRRRAVRRRAHPAAPTPALLAARRLRRRRRRRRRSRQPRHDPALGRGRRRRRRRRSRRARSTPFNPKVVRASAGALFHVPGRRPPTLADVRRGRAAARRHVVAPRHRRTPTPTGRAGVAIVAGSEAHGLARRRRRSTSGCASSTRGRAESLNVAMATTVLCFEARHGPRRVIALCRRRIRPRIVAAVHGLARRRFRCPG